MIRGTVRIKAQDGPVIIWEPRIDIEIAGVNLEFRTVQAVVDTGFTGALALPGAIVEKLGLTYLDSRPARLATGLRLSLDVYGAVVSWCGQRRAVFVYKIDGDALVGASLLTNCRLTIDFREGGDVTIRPLRQDAPA